MVCLLLCKPADLPASSPTAWEPFIAQALSADTPSEFAEAETQLEQLRQAGHQWDPRDMRLVWSLARLATFYHAHHQLTKAETYQKQLLQWMETPDNRAGLLRAAPLGELAAIQFAQGRLVEARQTLEQALTLVEEEGHPAHLLTVRLLEQLAAIHLAQDNPQEAGRLQQRLTEIQEQSLTMETPGDAIVLAHQGKRHLQEGREELAASLFQQSREILMETSGPYHGARVEVLTSLAHIAHNDGDHAQEVELLKSALAVSENMRGTHHPDLLPLLKKLAIGYQQMGKPNLGRPIIVRTLALVEELYGKGHDKTAETLLAMADNLRLENQPDPAIGYYNRAMVTFRHLESTSGMTQTALGLARALHLQGKIAAALHSHGEALEWLSKTLGPDHPDCRVAQQYQTELQAELASRQQGRPASRTPIAQQLQILQERVLTLGGTRQPTHNPDSVTPFAP
ncbi:MAG: tetratricopeptide repeat protein [Magnetococcus sp. DMHC-8]